MGVENDVICSFINSNDRFADLYNGICFNGAPMINAQDLQEASEVYAGIHAGDKRGKTNSFQRIRDIKKRLKDGTSLKILAVENQSHIDYSMPWRCMNYDDLEYERQLKDLKLNNQLHKVYSNESELLCRLKRSDRLAPAFTLCLYYGEEPWDGPRSLKDMMNFGQGAALWQKWFADYPLHLVCINELKDCSCFKTSLKELFTILPYRKNKTGLIALLNEHPEYQRLDEDTAQTISILMGVEKFMENKDNYQKEGTYNMCQALQEMMEDSRSEGIEQGIHALIDTCLELGLNREFTKNKTAEKFGISQDQAEHFMLRFWK